MNTITDIFQFLRKPDFESIQKDSGTRITIFLTTFMWLFLFTIGVNMLITILQIFISNRPIMPNLGIGQQNHLTWGWKIWNILNLVLLAPILEEFSYRYALGPFNVTRIKISLSLVLAFHVSYFLYYFKLHQLCGYSLILHLLSLYGLMLSIAGIFFLITSLFNKRIAMFENKWNTHPSMIFYLSAILFAVYHVYSVPVLFLITMFAGSLVFGYTRIRLGFAHVIALHVLWNLLSSFRLWVN